MKVISLFFFVLVLFNFPNTSFGNTDVLRADGRHRPPWINVSNGKIGGPLYEIAVEAANRAGITMEWKLVPFARSHDDIRRGVEVVLPRMAKNTDRESYTDFTVSVLDITREVVFAVPSSKNITIDSYADLAGKKIGVKRKGSYFEKFDNDQELIKYFVKDDVQLVKMLGKGRLDVAGTPDRIAFEKAAKLHDINNWKYADYKHSFNTGIYYGFPKNSIYFETFNKALQGMKSDGTLNMILQTHGFE